MAPGKWSTQEHPSSDSYCMLLCSALLNGWKEEEICFCILKNEKPQNFYPQPLDTIASLNLLC